MIEVLVLALLIAVVFLVVGLSLISITAYQAYRRGYNPIVWGLAAILALNPIFLLVVLALAPHRSRLRLRAKFAAELDAQLARRPSTLSGDRSDPIDAAAPTASVSPGLRRATARPIFRRPGRSTTARKTGKGAEDSEIHLTRPLTHLVGGIDHHPHQVPCIAFQRIPF